MNYEHIVEMEKWCKKCKYFEKEENEDPCFDCLSDPVNYATRKPTKYEEAEKEKDK